MTRYPEYHSPKLRGLGGVLGVPVPEREELTVFGVGYRFTVPAPATVEASPTDDGSTICPYPELFE